MKSKLIIAGLLALVVVALGAVMTFNGGAPVEAAKVTKGDISEFVEERGKTRLPRLFQITMPYDARIGAIEILEGSHVAAGQTVAQIIPGDLDLAKRAAQAAVERLQAMIRENDDVSVEETSLEQARNQVESTKRTVDAAKKRADASSAKLKVAERNFQRVESLKQKSAKTDEEYEQSELALVDATLQYQHDLLQWHALESTQAATALSPKIIQQGIARKSLTHRVLEKQLDEAHVRLIQATTDATRGVLTSPVDGVVLERLVSDEKRVTGGTVLLTIGRLEDLEVEADVLSQEVVAIEPNDLVEIAGPSIGPEPVKGNVARIFPSGFTKISSLGVEQQRVKVIVRFAENEMHRVLKRHVFGAEYRVRVRIFTDSRKGVLLVPRSSVFRDLSGGWQVFAIRNSRLEFQSIETGLINDDRVEVRRGLEDGDLVVLAPESDLAVGKKVTPRLREPTVVKEVFSSDD